jgi:hypothetical protein
MVLARSLVRIGGRRVVLSRSPAIQPRCIPFLRATTPTVHVQPPWRGSRRLATASAIVRVEDTGIDLSSPPRASSSSTAIAQTDGNQDVLAKLVGIRELLVDELGGSEEWVERVDGAIKDLKQDRKPTLGGELICVSSLGLVWSVVVDDMDMPNFDLHQCTATHSPHLPHS